MNATILYVQSVFMTNSSLVKMTSLILFMMCCFTWIHDQFYWDLGTDKGGKKLSCFHSYLSLFVGLYMLQDVRTTFRE